MRNLILLAAFMLPCMVLHGQEKIQLQVGQPFSYRSNEELNKLLHRESVNSRRKVIIDLFASSCPACFSMMPKMQKLQEMYGDSLLVVMLGQRDKEIEKIYNRFRQKFNLTLAVVYDTSFFKTHDFPGFPFYIWLDENGIVIATSESDEVHEGSVLNFIQGKFRPEKEKEKITYKDPALTFGQEEHDSSYLFRSKLGVAETGELSYYPQRLICSFHNRTAFLATGVTVDDLYRYAYFGIARWVMKDPEYAQLYPFPMRIGGESREPAGMKLNYIFQARNYVNGCNLLQRALQNDLATFFGYEVQVTAMRVPCWKLVALPGAKEKLRTRFTTKSVKTSYTYQDFRCVPVSRVLEIFQFSMTDQVPIIDQTGIDFPIDIIIDAPVYDRESVVSALRLAGLDLVKGETKMKVLLLEMK